MIRVTRAWGLKIKVFRRCGIKVQSSGLRASGLEFVRLRESF